MEQLDALSNQISFAIDGNQYLTFALGQDDLCRGLLWHLPYCGVLPAAGSQAQGSASWHRLTLGHPHQVWAPSSCLTFYRNFRTMRPITRLSPF
jgi:hypothetical protein